MCPLGGGQLLLGSRSLAGDGGGRGDAILQAEGKEQVLGRERKRYGGLGKEGEKSLLEKAAKLLPHRVECRDSMREQRS